MKRSVVLIQKPVGYVSPKALHVPSLSDLIGDENAQGGIIGLYISIMIAAILVLNVVWPTIDSMINPADPGNSSYNNLSTTAKTIVGLFGLVLMLGLLVMILNPVM